MEDYAVLQATQGSRTPSCRIVKREYFFFLAFEGVMLTNFIYNRNLRIVVLSREHVYEGVHILHSMCMADDTYLSQKHWMKYVQSGTPS